MLEEKKSLQPAQKNGGMPSGEKIEKGFGVVSKEKSAELAAIAVAAAAKADVESAYIMAMHRPRNEENARIKINNICKNVGFASKAKYRKPVGKIKNERGQWVQNYVTGPSIRFAEEMLRLWGNIKSQQAAIYEDEHKRVVRIVMIDLETNASYSKEITIAKHVERKNAYGREVIGERINTKNEVVFIVKATEDEILNKEAALASKVIRNNGLRLIPEHIIEETMMTVDSTLKEGISQDPDAAKRQIADAFASLGVMPSDLGKYFNQPLSSISPAQVAELRDIYNTIKDGQATWVDYVGGENKKGEGVKQGTLDDLIPGDKGKHQDVTKPLKKTK